MDTMGESSLVPRAYPVEIRHLSDEVHGILMGLTVALILPFGALSWHLFNGVFSTKTILHIHIFSQLLGLALLISGFGAGVWVAIVHGEVYTDKAGHAILGTILIILFLIQPILGAYHHYYIYRAGKSNQTVRLVHVWLGRLLWIVAVAEGGTGLYLGNNSVDGEKAFGAITGVVGLAWIVILIVSFVGKRRTPKETESPTPVSQVEKGDIIESSTEEPKRE